MRNIFLVAVGAFLPATLAVGQTLSLDCAGGSAAARFSSGFVTASIGGRALRAMPVRSQPTSGQGVVALSTVNHEVTFQGALDANRKSVRGTLSFNLDGKHLQTPSVCTFEPVRKMLLTGNWWDGLPTVSMVGVASASPALTIHFPNNPSPTDLGSEPFTAYIEGTAPNALQVRLIPSPITYGLYAMSSGAVNPADGTWTVSWASGYNTYKATGQIQGTIFVLNSVMITGQNVPGQIIWTALTSSSPFQMNITIQNP